jgi:RNA polymerase sigma-70 factor (ECF subfamily)
VALSGRHLLEGLRDRDPVAIGEVVDQQGRRIYRAARGLGFSPADAEDLAQEVFLTFLESLDRFEGRSTVGTWLFGILHHKAQERRRAHAREDSTSELEEAFDKRFDANGFWLQPPVKADRLVESRQAGEMVRDCLDALPAQQRVALPRLPRLSSALRALWRCAPCATWPPSACRDGACGVP